MTLCFEPLDAYGPPAYPTSRDMPASPGVLWRNTPAAWRGQGKLRSALALLLGAGALGAGSGCTYGVPGNVTPLTERDALRIIRSELSQHGVKHFEEKVEIPGILLHDAAGQQRRAVFDVADPQGAWAIEYLDPSELGPEDRWRMSGFADTARRLESEVAAQAPNTHLKVLYTEFIDPREKAAAAARAKRELRQQLRDFFDWLAAQGAM